MKRITVTVKLSFMDARNIATDYHNNAACCPEPAPHREWKRLAVKFDKAIDAAIAASKRARGKL